MGLRDGRRKGWFLRIKNRYKESLFSLPEQEMMEELNSEDDFPPDFE